MDEQERRRLRHDMRGKWSALRLCLAALDVTDTPEETAEMLEMIMNTADELAEVAEQVAALPDEG